MVSKRVIGLLLAVLAISLAAMLAAFQAGNPQINQGGSGSFAPTGTHMSLSPSYTPTLWAVHGPTGQMIAWTNSLLGWSVTYSQSTNQLTVTVPANAAVGNGYEARYFNSAITPVQARSAYFDVVAGGSPPAAPSGLQVTSTTHSSLSLSWVDNSNNETSFQVLRKGPLVVWQQPWYEVATLPANQTSFVNSGLDHSSSYHYIVKAINGAGSSAASNEITGITDEAVLPNSPSGLIGTPLSSTRIRLDWTDNSSNEDGFSVERFNYSNSTWSVAGSVGASITTFTDAGLSPLTSYGYRVKSYNPAGSSAPTSVIDVATLSGPPASSRGTEFWLAMPSSGSMGFMLPRYDTIFITADAVTSGTVSIPGGTFTQNFTLLPGASASIVIPQDQMLGVQDGTESKAIRVVSDAPVGVQVNNIIDFSSEGFTALPVETLGKEYIAVTYKAGLSGSPNSFGSVLAVVAAYDSTQVTITPSISVSPRTSQTPYTITLNKGQAYQLKALSQGDDLTGTVVSADKPVSVFSGNQGTLVPEGVSSANPLMECLTPVDRWGTEFVAVPYATRTNGDLLRIVAARNDTIVYESGVQVGTLARGGWLERDLTAPKVYTSNKPILLFQMSKGAASDNHAKADPFASLVPSLSQFGSLSIFRTPELNRHSPNYVNVVTFSGAVGDLRLDGTIVPAASFTPVGATTLRTAQLSVGAGQHKLETPGTGLGIGAYAYGYGAIHSDGYGLPATVFLPVTPGFDWTPPTAPSGLTATAVSASQINLTWTDTSSDEQGFRIERWGGTGGIGWQFAATVGANVTSFSNTGLNKTTTYIYRVRAFNDLNSGWSNDAQALTWDTPPNGVGSLSAAAQSQSQINLSWTDSSTNETSFKIERKQGTAGTWAQIGTAPANTSTYQDTGLVKKTLYIYRVRASNSYGDSPYSPEAQATTKDSPPIAPNPLTATAPVYNRVELSWTDNSDNEQGFKLERKTGSGAFSQIATLSANITTFNDLTAQGGTTYVYQVRAYNDGGDSAWSNQASATTPAPPIPTAPTNLTATGISSSQIQLAWTDTTDCESTFTVQRAPGGTSNWTTVATLPQNTQSWTDSGLAAQTSYSYRVNASNLTGASSWAGPVSATTPQEGEQPWHCSAYPTSATTMRIHWKQPSAAANFRVYRSTTPNARVTGNMLGQVSAKVGSDNWFDDGNLSTGTTYYYQITAMYGASESAPSFEDSQEAIGGGLPLNQAPSSVTSFAAQLTGDPDTIVLTPQNTVYSNGSIIEQLNWTIFDIVSGNYNPQPNQQANSVPSFRDVILDGFMSLYFPNYGTMKPEGGYYKVHRENFFNQDVSKTSVDFYLPMNTPSNINSGMFSDGAQLSSGHCYIGIETESVNVDGGLSFMEAQGSHPDRWRPIFRLSDSRQANANSGYKPTNELALGLPESTGKYLPAGPTDLCFARVKCVMNRRTRVWWVTTQLFRVNPSVTFIGSATLASVGAFKNNLPSGSAVSAKIVVSCAQKSRSYLGSFFNNAPPRGGWPNAYFPDGTFFKNIGVTRERLWNGQGAPEEIWRDSWASPDNIRYLSGPVSTITTTGGAEPVDIVSISH